VSYQVEIPVLICIVPWQLEGGLCGERTGRGCLQTVLTSSSLLTIQLSSPRTRKPYVFASLQGNTPVYHTGLQFSPFQSSAQLGNSFHSGSRASFPVELSEFLIQIFPSLGFMVSNQ
jgi:hypothetical protein